MIARNFNNDEMTDSAGSKGQPLPKTTDKNVSSKHWYSIPDPVRRLFDEFPLITYQENSIPQRAIRKNRAHTLYIFSNPFDKTKSGISCNPACLKWQAYLKFNDIDFNTKSSNNHASPSGSLPFLLPAPSTKEPNPLPLTTGKIPRWTSQQTMQEEDGLNMTIDVYTALVDQNIRNAWLYHLYLVKANFDSMAQPLYVNTASSNRFVRSAIAHQLRQAALSELLKSRVIVDGTDIYIAARKSFKALSTLLGSGQYFSNEHRPGLFDASIFAYTHLLLDDNLPWSDTNLSQILHEYPRLVDHRQRLLKGYMQR